MDVAAIAPQAALGTAARARDGDAGGEELQLLGRLRRREADEVQSILIRDEAEHGCAIAGATLAMPLLPAVGRFALPIGGRGFR